MDEAKQTHHATGPSKLYRISECPGSVRLERLVPDADKEESTSEIARMGTLKHRAVVDDAVYAELPSDTDREHVDEARRVLLDSAPLDAWENEVALSLKDGFYEILYGTCDHIAYLEEAKMMVIVDFKFGWIPADEASNNLQLAAYAAAASQVNEDIERVHVILAQPTFHEISQATYTMADIATIIDTIRDIVAKTHSPQLILHSGGHCKYCDAKKACPAYAELEEVVSTDSGLVSASQQWLTTVTPDNAREIWDRCKVVEQRIKDLKDEIKTVVQQNGAKVGEKTRGLRITERKAAATIQNIQKTFELASDVMSEEAFLQHCKISSVTKLRDAYAALCKEAGLVPTAKAGKEKFEKVFPIERGAPIVQLTAW